MSDQVRLEKEKILIAAMIFNANLLRHLREKHPDESSFLLVVRDKSKVIGKSEYQEIEDQIDLVIKAYKRLNEMVSV